MLMLTPEQIEALMVIFDERSQTIEDEYLKRLGQHMRDFGELLPSDAHQLAQLKRMDRNMDELKRKMAKTLSADEKTVDEILVKVAKYNLDFAELQFGKGLTDEQRKAKRAACARSLALMVSAQSKVTKGEMRNLSQTTILSTNYRQCVDTAIHAVQTGMRDYQSEIRSVMRKTSREGLRVLYPNSGMTRRLDSAVRMNVLDGVRSLNQQAALECGRTYGADGVEVSAHPLCAFDHVHVQGHQYTNSEFDDVQNELDREIGQWNCKHFAFPIVMGVSQPAYTDEQLQTYEKYSNEEIEIDGHKHSRYEWSQVQRRLETNARYINDDRTLFKASGDTAAVKDCDTKFEKNLLKYQDICAKAGLEPDYSRMRGTSYPDSAFKGILGREYNEGEQRQTDFVKLRANVDSEATNLKQVSATIKAPTDEMNPYTGEMVSVLEKALASSTDDLYMKLLSGLNGKVDYNPVHMTPNARSNDEIIDALSGGDLTQGSCASLALAYIGQRNGWNVLDFRDGDSRRFYSRSSNLYNISKMDGVSALHYGDVTGKTSATLANNYLKTCEIGKEYYLCVGRHAAIVRRNAEGKLQYLELQSSRKNGWIDFNGNPKYTLTNRFGCYSSSGKGEYYDFMMNITDSKLDTDEFRSLLGYINTKESEQRKGKNGTIK